MRHVREMQPIGGLGHQSCGHMVDDMKYEHSRKTTFGVRVNEICLIDLLSLSCLCNPPVSQS